MASPRRSAVERNGKRPASRTQRPERRTYIGFVVDSRLKTRASPTIVEGMARLNSVRYKSNSPLASCPVDGLFVAAGAAAVATGNAKLIISHCGTNCPTCGGSNELLPGLYEPDGANIRLLLDPGVSAEALEALQKLLRAVVAGEITPERAIKEAEKVHAGWGKLFDLWSTARDHSVHRAQKERPAGLDVHDPVACRPPGAPAAPAQA